MGLPQISHPGRMAPRTVARSAALRNVSMQGLQRGGLLAVVVKQPHESHIGNVSGAAATGAAATVAAAIVAAAVAVVTGAVASATGSAATGGF